MFLPSILNVGAHALHGLPKKTCHQQRWWRMSLVRSAVPNPVYHYRPLDPRIQGWTIFDNLFLLNGTVFVVTDTPERIPDRAAITSKGLKIANGAEAVAARLPTDRELRVISTIKAQELLGDGADLIDGTTVRYCCQQAAPHPSPDTRFSGSSMIHHNCTLLQLCSRDLAKCRILLSSSASHIITIGLPSSSLGSGGHTLHWTHPSLPMDHPCFLPYVVSGSPMRTPTTGETIQI